ncbi:MAG: cytochrome c3 family protein [Kiritimatiellaeota bacterium]|nr:cytochrome c3 family protein [Kiritimatiellota bacterium]
MMKKWMITAMALTTGLAFAGVEAHWDGGRNTPVHRLALNDELGDTIIPSAQDALPVSTKQTCGQCHDYAAIASGWHFNMTHADAKSGRPSEPYFLVDAATGSQIPMGLRDWAGLYKPGQLGMSNWEFVSAFGRHLPGGSIADPDDLYAEGGSSARWDVVNGRWTYDFPSHGGGSRVRWNVSGPLEINCFACHSLDKEYDHSEWVRQITRHNFRWAMTGALGLGEVGGMGSRVDDYWDMLRGPNRDDSIFKVPPHMKYDVSKFDSKNRTVLELGKPRNENCLSCHSATQAGMGAKDIDGDVHLRAGMSCADCHGNGLDHATARGFVGDNTGAMDKVRATASCTGCHNGTDTFKAGRFGAPAPKHVGMPSVHFEKLNCTVCHSGVTENGDLAQVRTSRSNRMGVYGRARWVTPQPFIMEPVFVKDANGKITPSRMVWPAFWGTAKGDAVEPINPEILNALCDGLFNVREQVGTVLGFFALNPNIPGKPALIKDKTAFVANVDGVIVPAGKADSEDGFYYQTDDGFVVALPLFDRDADDSNMTAEQKEVLKKQKTLLENILKTLDAADKAAKENLQGAVVMGGKVFYMKNIVIDEDTGETADVAVSKPVTTPSTNPLMGWIAEEGEGDFIPFWDDYVARNATQLAGSDYSLTEDMVAAGLARLQEQGVASPVYVAHGKVWSLAADGKLSAKEDKAAAPVSWAVGHDVRPARMARGAKPVKCADCHTVGSKFFFANVESTGPLLTAQKMVKAQCEYMGISGSYNRLFGTTFLMRPMFKIFVWVVFAFVALVAVAFVAAAVPMMLRCSEADAPYGKHNAKLMEKLNGFAMLGMVASTAYLGLSGVLGWFFHLMTGYILVFHMVAGGLFATCLVALIFFRGGKRIKTKRAVLWMLMLVLGVCVLFTAVAPMMTWFGAGWQHVLLQGHRCATMCFIALSGWMLITGGRKE